MNERLQLLGRALAIAVLFAFVAACAPTGTVVLLPEKDGHKTAVAVKRGDKEVVLDHPYAAVEETPLGLRAYQSDPQDVKSRFGAALAAQPQRASRYVLQFVEGKDELTDESKAIVDGIFSEIASRPVPDVLVIGHTDTVGSEQVNDALALKRAQSIRDQLVRRGVRADSIQVIARGKRDPIVQTANGVAEQRNRRVEIIVR